MLRIPGIMTPGRLVVVICAALAGAVVTAPPASADQFDPQNTAPVISSPSLIMSNGRFEPDAAESDANYKYDLTITDAESLNDLNRVDLCLYHSMNEIGGAGEGDPTCAVIDPRNTVKLSWVRSTNAFSILTASSNNYWRLGNGANTPVPPTNLTATTGTISFRFKISEAMREGTWRAKVTATDVNGATATDSSLSAPVTAYSSITVRTEQSFGTLASGVPSTRTATPKVTSNGATTVSLTAGDFSGGGYTFGLKTTGGAPAAGQVTFDCISGSTYTEASATRITASPTLLGAATSTGTPEQGTDVSNTCRLTHGGSRPVYTYSFTVVHTVSNA